MAKSMQCASSPAKQSSCVPTIYDGQKHMESRIQKLHHCKHICCLRVKRGGGCF